MPLPSCVLKGNYMKQPTISLDKAEQMAKEMGFSVAPKDHQVYSEGFSINLLSRTQKQSGQKDTVSLPNDSQNDLDSVTPTETSSNSD